MTELLSPAGSPEAVIAAVQNGADAVYLGLGDFNARRGAKNFTEEEFEKAMRYCRIRGCRVYVTLNTLVDDRETEAAVAQARLVSSLGADGLIVQDLGLVRALRAALPDIPLHASTQMSIHNLAGVEAAAEMGLTRAVLARELSIEQIRYISSRAPIETEVFVHGALCFCHSGQCYMSALIGRRSGNRGMCAQPCRMAYSLGGRMDDYPLSLKDNCLVDKLAELEDAGVACLKIEGRMKRPEYTALVTGVYAKVLHERRAPTQDELNTLETAFSRDGFTQGYYNGDKKDMFGVRGEGEDRESEKLFTTARKDYSEGELRRVPLHFYTLCEKGQPIRAIAFDDDGHKAVTSGPMPEAAKRQGLTESFVVDQMFKTGGTPYNCVENRAKVDPFLFIPTAEINDLRRRLITQISEERAKPPLRRSLTLPPLPEKKTAPSVPQTIFQVRTPAQLSDELCELKPDYLYFPAMGLVGDFSPVRKFAENGTKLVAVLPRVITDDQSEDVFAALEYLAEQGVNEALVGNLGHVAPHAQRAVRRGLPLRHRLVRAAPRPDPRPAQEPRYGDDRLRPPAADGVRPVRHPPQRRPLRLRRARADGRPHRQRLSRREGFRLPQRDLQRAQALPRRPHERRRGLRALGRAPAVHDRERARMRRGREGLPRPQRLPSQRPHARVVLPRRGMILLIGGKSCALFLPRPLLAGES